MAQFKVGDRVKIIKACNGDGNGTKIGEVYTLIDWKHNGGLWTSKMGCSCDSSWELISSPKSAKISIMGKLSNLARSVFDKDYRKMIKIGWLNSDLSITEEGKNVILADYLAENKIKFGKLANEQLKEKCEENCTE